MKSPLFGLILITLALYACSNVQKSSEVPDDTIKNDSIQRQQFVDSLLSTVVWDNTQSHISYLGLNGHVSKIECTKDGSAFYLPYKTIHFDKEGKIISVFRVRCPFNYNYILKDDKLSKILRLGVEGAGLGIEFNMVRSDNKSIFESYDEMGSSKYTFSRNSNNEISNLEILYSYYPDMDAVEPEESRHTFRAQVNSYDNHNNWTSLTLFDKDKNTIITRKITYIDEPSFIKYFESNSGDKILFKFPTEYNNFYLKIYDCSTKQWKSLIPPPYEDETYGYKDFKLINNNLYLIFKTGNNWIDAVCGIYLYDINTNKWTELDMGSEECEFVGNSIKVIHYEVLKYGDCTANNEYEEIVNWIELK